MMPRLNSGTSVPKVRRMIGKIQRTMLKDVSVGMEMMTVTLLHVLSAWSCCSYSPYEYDNDIDKLEQWNQADNNDVERGKPKISQLEVPYENFNGDLTQFKDIDKCPHTFDRC